MEILIITVIAYFYHVVLLGNQIAWFVRQYLYHSAGSSLCSRCGSCHWSSPAPHRRWRSVGESCLQGSVPLLCSKSGRADTADPQQTTGRLCSFTFGGARRGFVGDGKHCFPRHIQNVGGWPASQSALVLSGGKHLLLFQRRRDLDLPKGKGPSLLSHSSPPVGVVLLSCVCSLRVAGGKAELGAQLGCLRYREQSSSLFQIK